MAKNLGSKKTKTKEMAAKGCVKMAAGGAAKVRKGFPMTKGSTKKK